MSRFEDGILVAYVDGELDDTLAREVEAASANDAELRHRIELLRLSGAVARAAFREENSGAMPPDAARVRRAARHSSAWRFRLIALFAAVFLLIAMVSFKIGVWPAKPGEVNFTDHLLQEVANDYAIFAVENQHPLEIDANRTAQIESLFRDRLQRRLRVPDLTDRGLIFRGARLLVIDKQSIAELVYSSAENQSHPLALCITAHATAAIPLKTAERDGIDLALWGDGTLVYVLAGWLDQPTLASLAAEIKPTQDTN